MSILQWFQTRANWRRPIDKHEATTLHLLVRLVQRMDDRLRTLEEQNKVIIDQSNRILRHLDL